MVACEFSGVVRDAFIEQGHDAVSCDILPTESEGPHIQDDILNHLNERWDMMIAHPPCTYLANSGVRWLYEVEGRWEKMKEGALFFNKLLNAKIKKICVENPIPHKYAIEIIGSKYHQIVQPWMFGHGETKATCFWLKNLPELEPTKLVEGREGRIWKIAPSEDRWKKRSITYPGIAKAMAQQWGQ